MRYGKRCAGYGKVPAAPHAALVAAVPVSKMEMGLRWPSGCGGFRVTQARLVILL